MRSESALALQEPAYSVVRDEESVVRDEERDVGRASRAEVNGSSCDEGDAGIHVDSSANETAPLVAVATAASIQELAIASTATSLVPTKEDYLQNDLNPPLVAATPIQQPGHRTVDPLAIIQMDQEQPSSPAGVLSRQLEVSPSDVVRVYVDDEQSTPPLPEHEDSSKKRGGYWKIGIIAILCTFVGATIGLAAGSKRVLKKGTNSVEKEETLAPAGSDSLNPKVTSPPSRSASPSSAPSCAQGFRFAWAENYTDMPAYPVFASGATYGDSKRTLGVLAYYDLFYGTSTMKTFVLSTETGIQEEIEQEFNDAFEVQSLAVSDDGVTMVLGVTSYVSETEGVGGAFMIFERFKPNTDLAWNLTQVHFTGGEEFGSVIDVAISDNGTVIAVSAIDVNLNMLVSVYQISGNQAEPMRGSFPAENVTTVELSGDGTRLFMAARDSRIYVYDFSFRDGWSISGKLFFESQSSVSLHVSRYGDILVVGDGRHYASYPVKVHALMDSRWETINSISGNFVGDNSFVPALSKDGSYLFLTGLFLDGMDQLTLGGNLFRRGLNGFQNIYSVPLTQDYTYSFINSVHFNEDMTQLVISTNLGLLGLERMCASEIGVPSPTPTPPTVVLAPTSCFVGFDDPWLFNFSEEVGGVSFDGDPIMAFSQDGSTLVITNTINNTYLYVMTLDVSQNGTLNLSEVQFGSASVAQAQVDLIPTPPMSLNVVGLSGDGRTLLYGVGLYAQKDGNNGGAFVVYRRADVSWEFIGVIETGGGEFGAVVDVTSSFDGSVIAFSTSALDGDSYVDIYSVSENSLFPKNKQGIPEDVQSFPSSSPTSNDDVTVGTAKPSKRKWQDVVLSGSGQRLFISTNGATRSLDFDDGCGCWYQVGNTIMGDSYGEIQVSFSGNTIVISAAFYPIRIFELQKRNYWMELASSNVLNDNETQNENLALMALSSDGKSIFVAHTYPNICNSSFWNSTGEVPLSSPYSDNNSIFFADTGSVNIETNDDNSTIFADTGSVSIETNDDVSTGYMYVSHDGTWDFVEIVDLDQPGLLIGATFDESGNLLVVTDQGASVYPALCADAL
jgi:hypothetical protein